MKNFGRLISTYKYLLSILMKNAPMIVISVFLISIVSGVLAPLNVYVNTNLFNISLSIASKEAAFSDLTPYIILFIILSLLPNIISLYIYGYAEPNSMLILRSTFRGEMLQKLKRMKYEHLESESSMEIIDKAYSRAENSARHLFPMYINNTVSSLVGTIGSLYIIISVKWWLIFPILIPFFIETILANRSTYNIYTELESYWQKEREYELLQSMLQNRDIIRENRLNQASDYLIKTYRGRFNARNKRYETFYFKGLKRILLTTNISRFAIIGNIIILLMLYVNGQMSIGLFISVSILIFNSLYSQLDGCVFIFKWGHYHANFFEYYMKYFELSEDKQPAESFKPDSYDIEFKDVWFKYPGTERYILKGLSLHINNGEKNLYCW